MKLPPIPFVDLRKLRDYSLSSTHPEGKQKARVFRAALGIDARDAEWLRDELLLAAAREECTLGTATAYGQRYVLDFTVRRNGLEAGIRSAWIIRAGEQFPPLTSCYVL